MERQVYAQHQLKGRVKITKPDGRVFYQDIPEGDIEVYQDQHGNLSSVYPEDAELEGEE